MKVSWHLSLVPDPCFINADVAFLGRYEAINFFFIVFQLKIKLKTIFKKKIFKISVASILNATSAEKREGSGTSDRYQEILKFIV